MPYALIRQQWYSVPVKRPLRLTVACIRELADEGIDVLDPATYLADPATVWTVFKALCGPVDAPRLSRRYNPPDRVLRALQAVYSRDMPGRRAWQTDESIRVAEVKARVDARERAKRGLPTPRRSWRLDDLLDMLAVIGISDHTLTPREVVHMFDATLLWRYRVAGVQDNPFQAKGGSDER